MKLTEENTSNTMVPTMFDYHSMTGDVPVLYHSSGVQDTLNKKGRYEGFYTIQI